MIVSCAIHPAIGIARVGNSVSDYFIGSEIPGIPARPLGGYKDAGSRDRVKRQAARFRVFGYDVNGQLVGEITAAEANVTWTVQLANAKAEWDRFDGRRGEELALADRRPMEEWRNNDIVERDKLVIRSGAAELTGAGKRHLFDDGRFFDVPVMLGEARTDAVGRLLVLAGHGKSGTVEEGRLISHYANNDRWYDDIADGPVKAMVTLPDGRQLQAKPAWVLTAPPDFAPDMVNVVTLYDVAENTAIESGWLPAPARPSFIRHIYPVLDRALQAQWTNERARSAHERWARKVDMSVFSNNGPEAKEARTAFFGVLRNPTATGEAAKQQANARFMPALAGDDGDCEDGDPGKWLALTRTQYRLLEQWSAGDFDSDWGTAPPPADRITPEGLDRAALEACTGGAFYPGIEGGWIFRNPETYIEPFRLNHGVLQAGDVTKRMALPWQADFFECNTHWWPSQRPDEVLPLAAYRRLRQIEAELENPELGSTGSDHAVRTELEREHEALLNRRIPWARGLPGNDAGHHGDNAMVQQWPKLGFVTAAEPHGEPYHVLGANVQVESEASEPLESNWADAFHKLINIEHFPEYRPIAFDVARKFFAKANYIEPTYQPFPYSVNAFRERLNLIYNQFVAAIDAPHWLNDFPKAAVVENLRQKAPMNLTDGAWLQNIVAAGPVDEIRAKLFAIWADEAGNGESELNHSNVYDTLLRSLDVFLPPIRSRAFTDLNLLPEAYENPVFQLCVGLFPDAFFPELLGMTLYLEWEATPTMLPVVRMLKRHGIDPQYYAMHAAIDNVTAGHGAMAREAIELYLDQARTTGGEQAVQEKWQRVWNGYVTWASIGSLGKVLYNMILERYSEQSTGRQAKERMVQIIRDKAPYARTAHGQVTLGDESLAALFADPERLLNALQQQGWVNPAQPHNSKFVQLLLGFRGPMYKVFSADEHAVLLDWIASLASLPPPAPTSAANQVYATLKAMAERAAAEPLHNRYTISAGEGHTNTIAGLFAHFDAKEIMRLLASSEYVVLGESNSSTLMTRVFTHLMPNVLNPTQVAAFKHWIEQRCPMPGETVSPLEAWDGVPVGLQVRALERAEPVAAAPRAVAAVRLLDLSTFVARRQFIGAGSVH